MDEQARRELDACTRAGLDPLRQALWLASLTYLADATCAIGHEPMASLVYPSSRRYAGDDHDDRPRRRRLRRRRPLPGHGWRRPLGDSDRAAAHFEAALEVNRRMSARTWLAHTAYRTGGCCSAAERPSTARRAAARGHRARREHRNAHAARAIAARRRAAIGRRRCPTTSRRARCRCCGWSRGGSRTVRSAPPW